MSQRETNSGSQANHNPLTPADVRAYAGKAAQPPVPPRAPKVDAKGKPIFEQLEPMVLLSADLSAGAAARELGSFLIARSLLSNSLELQQGNGSGSNIDAFGAASRLKVSVTGNNETKASNPSGSFISGLRAIDRAKTQAGELAADSRLTEARRATSEQEPIDTAKRSSGGGDGTTATTDGVPANNGTGTGNQIGGPNSNTGVSTSPTASGTDVTNVPPTADGTPRRTPTDPNYLLPGLDLRMMNATAPAEARMKQEIRVSWTVKNEGSATLDGTGWHDIVYFSYDQTLDRNDLMVTSRWTSEFNPLAPGQTYTYTRDVALPEYAVGDGYLIFSTDRWDRVAETNETNNKYVLAIDLTDAPTNPVDPTPSTGVFGTNTDGPGTPTPISVGVKQKLESGLNQLRDSLNAMMSTGLLGQTLPFFTNSDGTPATVGNLLGLGNLLETRVFTPIRTYLANINPDSNGLVSVLDGLAETDGVVTGGLYNNNNELRFNFNLNVAKAINDLPISLGQNADNLGFAVSAGLAATLDVSATATATLSIGIDLTEGLGDPEAFFIRSNGFTAQASVSATNIAFGGRLGFVSLGIANGNFALNARANAQLINPDSDANGNITASELIGTSPSGLLSLSPLTATATASLPLQATIGSFVFPGTPTITLSGDPFSGLAPTVSTNAAFAELGQFDNFSPSNALELVQQFGTFLDSVAGSNLMGTQIPFTGGRTVGQVIDFSESVIGGVTNLLKDSNGRLTFDTIQSLATQLSTILGLPIGTIAPGYDAATNRFNFRLQFNRTLTPEPLPLNLNVGYAPLADFTTTGFLEATASANVGVTISASVADPAPGETLLDRIFITNATASASVGLNLPSLTATARFGFVGINVAGGNATANAQVALSFKNPTTNSASTPTSLRQFQQALEANPVTVAFNPSVTGSANLTLGPISVTGGIIALSGTPTITFSVPNVASPTINFTSSGDFAPVLAYREMDIGDITAALSSFTNYLSTISTFSFLNVKLPLVNKTVSEILNFASEFNDIIDDIQSGGAATLQTIESRIDSVLVPIGGNSTLSFTQSPIRALRIELDFNKNVNVQVPFNLNLAQLTSQDGGNPNLGSVTNLVGAGASGQLAAQAGVAINLDLGIDLTNPLSPQVFLYDTTSLALTAGASGSNLNFSASVGPLGIFITNGTATIGNGSGGPAAFTVNVTDTGSGRWYTGNWGTGITQVSLVGQASANLPVFFPTASNPLGPITFTMTDIANPTPANITLTLPNFANAINSINIFNNVGSLADGLDLILGALDTALAVGALASNLPLVGDKIGEAVRLVQDFRDQVVTPLRTQLATGAIVTSTARTILFNALGPSGLNVLRDWTRSVPANQPPGAPDGVIDINDVYVRSADTNSDGLVDDVGFEVRIGKSIGGTAGVTDFDIGFPALGLEVNGGVSANIGWELRLAMGVSRADGAYFDIAQANELTIGAQAAIPGLSVEGRLLFLTATVQDRPSAPSNVTAGFVVDIREPSNGNNNGRLSVSEILAAPNVSQIVNASVTANSEINLDLRLTLGDPNDTEFPELSAQLDIDWTFTSANPTANAPTITFGNIKFKLGDFFTKLIGPIIEKIQQIIEPIQPVIDVLTAPLPVLSDVAATAGQSGDYTLLDLAADLGLIDRGFIDALQGILDIISIVDNLGSTISDGLFIDLGSFNLNGTDVRNRTDFQGYNIPAANITAPGTPTRTAFNNNAGSFATANSNITGGGFQIPWLDNPASLFPILLGQDVTLFLYDMPKLELSAGLEFSFPIPNPIGIPLFAVFGGNFRAGLDLSFGFDTYGIRKAIETGNPLEVFNSFFIGDLDAQGKDIMEAYVTGEIYVGAEVDVFIAAVGIRGGIGLTIGLNLNDVDGDGKIRGKDLVQLPGGNPLCLFDFQGEIYAFLEGYLEIGIWPFEVTVPILPRISVTLVSFEWNPCDVTPPELATLDENTGVLTLNTGPRAALRGSVNTVDGAEDYEITRLGSYGVLVKGFDWTISYGRPDRPVTQIVGDMGNFDDRLAIDNGITFPTNLQGGTGNDTLLAGNGPSTVLGGDGDDEIVTGPGIDNVQGGNGNDNIQTGLGNDTVNGGDGDDNIVTSIGTPSAGGTDDDIIIAGTGADRIGSGWGNDNIQGDDGDDLIYAGLGNDTVFGGLGNDEILPEEGDDFIRGGAGNDIIRSSAGLNNIDGEADQDTIEGGADAETLAGGSGNDTITASGGNDIITGGSGDDTIYGGDGDDNIQGNQGNDTIFGEAGVDTIAGNEDNDTIDGGIGNDILNGDAGLDTIRGSSGNDLINGGSENDLIYGQEGVDTIFGNTGSDTIYGGSGKDVIRGNEDADTIYGDSEADTIYGDIGNDNIFGGSGTDSLRGQDGDDNVSGGFDSDFVEGNAGNDTLTGDEGDDIILGNVGDDIINGGSGNDRVWGEEGNDVIDGGTGDDVLQGGLGNDTVRGNDGNDQIYGDSGLDTLQGQAGNDVIVAGTGLGKTIEGGDGNDRIWGTDEGADTDPNFADASRFGDVISGGTGDDEIYGLGGADDLRGDAGNDRIDGGLGNDLVQGGDNNDWLYAGESLADQLRGDAGDDTIYGSFVGNDDIQGGTGNDTIFAQGGADNIQGNDGDDVIDAGANTDTVSGGLGNDTIRGGGGVGDTLNGDDGDDYIIGSDDGADIINAGSGRDRVLGMAGSDTISGGSGDDILQGGVGDDTISGDAGADLITGDANHDVLYGHSVSGAGDDNAVDYIYGDFGTNGSEANQGRDRLFGNGGNDQLFGEGDDDQITGGGGGNNFRDFGTGESAVPDDFVAPAATPAPSVVPGTALITFGSSLAAGLNSPSRFSELNGSASMGGVFTQGAPSQDAVSAVGAGDVFTAWSELQNGNSEIYVARWNSVSGWTSLGSVASAGGLSNSAGSSRAPAIALNASGNPVVAWLEVAPGATGGNIRLAQWDGANWVGLAGSNAGNGLSNTGTALGSPRLLMQGNNPVVAWLDSTSGQSNVFVRRWNGSAWAELGAGSASTDGISNSTTAISDFAIASNGTNITAVWGQTIAGLDPEIYALEWNGTSWNQLAGSASGGGVSNNTTDSFQPTVAYHSGQIFVAWQDNNNDQSQIFARRWNGSAWIDAGTASASGTGVSSGLGRSSRPQLVSNGTSLQLAWLDQSVETRTFGQTAVFTRAWSGTAFNEQLPGQASFRGVSLSGGDVRSLQLALDSTGRTLISWTDSTSGRPEAFVRYNRLPVATTYYVNDASTSGDNFSTAAGSNAVSAGTSASQPALSLQQLLNNFDINPGDIILIDTGSYAGATTIGAADGGAVIRGNLYGATTLSGLLTISGASDVTLENLTLTAGVSVTSGSTNAWIVDSRSGSISIAASSNTVVQRTTLTGSTGITVGAAATGTIIEQNTFSGNTTAGIAFTGVGSSGTIIRNNVLTTGGTGIDLATATGVTISNNTITNYTTGISITATATGRISDNLVTGGTLGLRYAARGELSNNTFTGATTGANVSTLLEADGLGYIGSNLLPNTFSNSSLGVQLTGFMRGQRVANSQVGVAGSGTLGGGSIDVANVIEGNTTGVDFTGLIRFNRIVGNTTGIDANTLNTIVHNFVYRNVSDGIDVNSANDVRMFSNTVDAPTGNAVDVRGTSARVEVRNNILWADSGYALFVANTAQTGFWSDFNTLFATGTGRVAYWTKDFTDILDLQADVAKIDLGSQGKTNIDPLWAQPRFVNRAFGDYSAFDTVAGRRFSSPTIDTADPASDEGLPLNRTNLLSNPGFESGLTGWTTNLGGSVRTTPAPWTGVNSFYAGNDASGFAEQTIDLVAAGFSAGQLDSQDFTLTFGGRVRTAVEAAVDRGQILIRFLNAGGSEISSLTQQATNTTDRWELVGSRLAIPTGARSVNFRFAATRVTGTTNDAGFDGAFMYVLPEAFIPDAGALGNIAPESQATAAPKIVIQSPDLYADWERARPQTITWTSLGNTADLPVRIELLQDGPDGPALLSTIAANTPDTGSFTWIPSTSGINFGTFGLRIQVTLVGQNVATDRSTETFTVPQDGVNYFVNDQSLAGDVHTSAVGNNRNTGKLASTPKPNPVNVIRTYDLQTGSTLFVDAGQYPLIDSFIGTGVAGIGFGTDRAFAVRGSTTTAMTEFVTAIPGNTSQSLIELYDADFMDIRDLTLTGGKIAVNARQGSTDLRLENIIARDNANEGILIEEASAFTLLRNITATNHPGNFSGVAVVGGAGGSIENLVASGNRHGLYVQGSGTNVTVTGGTIINNRSFGVYQDTTSNTLNLVNLTVQNNAGGGLFAGSIFNLTNTTINANTGWGIDQTNNFGAGNVTGSTISNNTAGGIIVSNQTVTASRIFGNTGPGLSISNSRTLNLINNDVFGNSTWGLENNSFNSTVNVRNNNFYGNTTGGVRLFNGSSGGSRQLINNTVDQATGDGIRIENGTTNVELRNNIIWTRGGYGVFVANDSQVGFVSNFNLLYATNTGRVGFWQGDRNTLTDWQFATFQDQDSLSADPLFVNAAAGDYHLQSTFGAFNSTTGLFVNSPSNSPAIDRGNPADAFNLEPANNGGYINLGSDGNTAEASRSPAQYVLVTNPNGGERIAQGGTFTVRWRSAGFAGNVRIEVSSTGPLGSFSTLSANEVNDGSYTWSIGSAAISDQYVLRITSVGTPGVFDSSNATFSVNEPISVYYVDDSSDTSDVYTPGAVGNDTNSGLSPLAPKASIRAVLQQYSLRFGDVILVDTGTYTLTANIEIDTTDEGVRIEGPASGPGATINRANVNSGNVVFSIVNADAVTLSNLRITGGLYGVWVRNGSSNFTIENSTIFNNGDRGISIDDNASSNAIIRDNTIFGTAGNAATDQNTGGIISSGWNPTFQRNRIYNVLGTSGVYGTGIDVSVTTGATGIATMQDNIVSQMATGISVTSSNFVVSGNNANFNSTGIYLSGQSQVGVASPSAFNNTLTRNNIGLWADSRVLVTNSTATDNNQQGFYGRFGSIFDGVTAARNGSINHANMYVDQGSVIRNSRVYSGFYGITGGFGGSTITGNTVFNNAHYGIGIASSNGTTTIANNLVYNNNLAPTAAGVGGIYLTSSSGVNGAVEIVNNTVYEPNHDAVRIEGSSANVRLRNNILIGGGTGRYAVNVANNSQTGFASDYNLLRAINSANIGFWQVPFSSLTDWSLELGFDTNSISTDPRFVDIDGSDNVLGNVNNTGWRYEGFANQTFTGSPTVTGVEPSIDTGSIDQAWYAGLTNNNQSIRYTAEVFIPAPGNYTFAIFSGTNRQRLFVNGNLLINDFTAAGSGVEQTGVFNAVSSGFVTVIYETVDDGGNNHNRLRWSTPASAGNFQLIGPDSARVVGSTGGGFTDDNFQLQSTVASRKTDGNWTADTEQSPAIDAGNPTDSFANEQNAVGLVAPLNAQAGDRIDLGAYGNTTSASRSQAAYVQILSPGNGEKFLGGQPITITWRSANTSGFLDIEFSSDGENYFPIGQAVIDDGEYTFTLSPTLPITNARIRIVDVLDPSIIATSVGAFSIGVVGTQFYVNDGSLTGDTFTTALGNNSNTGTTPQDPMRSISALIAAYNLAPGSIIRVDTGTYDLQNNIAIGSSDQGITILGPSTGAGATINRGNTSSNAATFDINNADDITLSNLRITGGLYGVWVRNGSSNFTIENSTIFNNGDRGISIDDNASSNAIIRDNTIFGTAGNAATDQNTGGIISSGWNPTFQRNRIYNVLGTSGVYGTGIDVSVTTGAAGIATIQDNIVSQMATGISVTSSNFVVSGNNANFNNTGIYLSGQSQVGVASPSAFNNTLTRNNIGLWADSRVLVTNSTATDNNQQGFYGRFGSIFDGVTAARNGSINYANMYVDQGSVIRNSRVYSGFYGITGGFGGSTITGNTVFNNAHYGIGIASSNGTTTIANNLVYNNNLAPTAVGVGGIYLTSSSGVNGAVEIVNNTVYEPNHDAVRIEGSSANARLRNNILIGGGTGRYAVNVANNSQTGFASDYNLLRAINSANIGFWQVPFSSLTDWSLELGFDTNSISTDPRFVDIDGSDNVLGNVNNTGWRYEGFANQTFTGSPTVTGVEPSIDTGSIDQAWYAGLTNNNQSIRYTAEVFIPAPGNYTFAIFSGTNRQRLFVNGNLLINDFTAAGSGVEQTGVFNAVSSGFVTVIYETVDDGGNNHNRLRWSTPASAGNFQLIGPDSARVVGSTGGGFTDDNFQLQSTVASRKTDGNWTADTEQSPAIDAGNPTDSFVNEQNAAGLVAPLNAQAGDRIDLGAYGNTTSASRSQAAYVQILSPDGGEKVRADRTILVRWRSANAGARVNVEFSPNGGTNWQTIAGNINNTGVFAWTPTTGQQTNNGLLRITSTTVAAATDTSAGAFVVGAPGNIYYVDDASNTNDVNTPLAVGDNLLSGTTPDDPMRSLAALVAAYDLNPGDIVLVDTGTYVQASNIIINSQDAGVTIVGPQAQGQVATINRANPSVTSSRGIEVFANNVTIRGLRVTGAYDGIYANNSSGLTIEDVVVFDTASTGLWVDDLASNVSVRRSEFFGTTASVNTDQNWGIYFEGDNGLVEDSQLYKVGTRSNNGIEVTSAANNFTYRRNLSFNNTEGAIISSPQFVANNNESRSNQRGFYFDDTTGPDLSQAFANEARDNTTGVGMGNRVEFYNNTVRLNSSFGLDIDNFAASYLVRDNLFTLNDTGAALSASSGAFRNNRVVGNTTNGVLIDVGGGGSVEGNTILGSSIGINATGLSSSSQVNIRNNLIYDNTNNAIRFVNANNNSFNIINNTIYHEVGSALLITNGLDNSTIANNNIAINGGFVLEITGTISATFTSDYNNLWRVDTVAGQTGRLNGTPATAIADWRTLSSRDTNSRSADPRFIDINGADNILGWDRLSPGDPFRDFGLDDNFSVSANSGMIDAADSRIAPLADIAGLSRVDDLGTTNSGGGVFRFYDIGAYEFQGSSNDATAPTITALAPVGLVNDLTSNTAVNSFVITFSERMEATSVRALALYTLTEAGIDGNFDTADDSPRVVSSISYTFGSLNATVNLPSTLPDGRYRLRIASQPTAAMVDLAGNRLDGDNNGTAGGDFSIRFRIDRTGPVVQSITPSGSLTVGPSQFVITFVNTGDINASTITNTANYTLLRSPDATFGNVDDVNISAQILNVSFNPGTYVATVQLAAPLPTNNRYRLVLGTGLRDNGNNPINNGTPLNHDIIVDSARPTAALAGVFASGRTNTNLGYVDVQWNDGAGSGVTTVNPLGVTITGVTVTGATAQGNGVYRYSYTGTLPQGTITVSALTSAATDGAGNTSLAATVGTFNFDAVRPTAQLVSPVQGSAVTTEPGFFDIRWLDNAPGTGINAATINSNNINVPGVSITGVTAQGGGIYRYTYSGTLGPQGATLTVTTGSSPVTDLAGNQFTGPVGSFIVNTVGPRIVNQGITFVNGRAGLDIIFSSNTNIQTLINNGTITSQIQIVGSSGTPITIALSRYSYNAATRTLRIDLSTTKPTGSLLTEGASYELRINRTAVVDGSSNPLADDDGLLDNVVRRNFVFTRPSSNEAGGPL